MGIAVLSDIQGVERLRRLACPVVMGNADAWLLTGRDSGRETVSPEFRAVLDEVREWSLSRLSPSDRAGGRGTRRSVGRIRSARGRRGSGEPGVPPRALRRIRVLRSSGRPHDEDAIRQYLPAGRA
jgi:hypothetical protein